ncbi:hypothetical protein [Bradyrhizobium erythrophlei]|uniref:Uncharacterized protein n=1 Tax=Bradyrhizobium erythrophlei TaxID=1437360 RepID=A0A1M5UFM5_9BRAD|nr:hypothetical protein [Bradyrhizobium erythrophlei]SHH61855.1 hypothetical protein SAMN05443248_5424 [Bradyrhizobium erythrophlei]
MHNLSNKPVKGKANNNWAPPPEQVAKPFTRTGAYLPINKREGFKGELEDRAGKSLVRIARLKPDASGIARPAGASLVFAAKHLPGMIAMLQALQAREDS